MERRDVLKQMALAMGYTLSATSLSTLMTNCAGGSTLDWQPQYLSSDQAAAIDALSEVILPKTNTPGAKELGVPQFLDVLVGEVMSEEDRNTFIRDLEEMMNECKTSRGKVFPACTPEEQKIFLDGLSEENNSRYPGIWGSDMVRKDQQNFFGKLRDTMVWAYFTSEVAGEQLLEYDPIPGKYNGCIKIDKERKAWSLS